MKRPDLSKADDPPPGVFSAGWFLGQILLLLLVSVAGAASLHYLGYTHYLIRIQGGSRMIWMALGLAAACLFLYRAYRQRRFFLEAQRSSRDRLGLELVRSRMQELSALFKVAAGLNLSLEIHELLNLAAQRLAAALTAQQVSVMLLARGSDELRTAASYGVEAEFARSARRKLGSGVAGRVAQTREALLTQGERHDGEEPPRDGVRSITSSMSVPILAGEECLGVLNINRISYPEDFTPQHLAMAETFGVHLGGLITQVQSVRKLARRTSQLESDLDAAAEQVREIDRLRDLFLSTASHELRTPVTAILGAVDVLDRSDPEAAEGERLAVQEIRGACSRLVEVVADMIDLANIDEGRVVLRMQETSLGDLMRSAVDSLRAVAERYEIPIEEQYDGNLPPVELDWIKMRHPLVQLLAHALQSTEEGKGILVRTFQEGEFLMVEVRSGGGTVSESEADRMLQMFGQGILKSQRTVGGSGVGLHLLKMMVELHGGRVQVESRGDQGVAYRIRLPRVRDHLTIISRVA